MIIAETSIFTKQLLSTLSDDEYRLFQAALLERPDAGKIVPGGGGHPKNVQENLTQDQLKQLKRIIEEEYHEG